MDRFGELPASVNNLLNVAFVKALAHKAYMVQVIHRGYEVKFFLYQKAKLNVSGFKSLLDEYGGGDGALRFIKDSNPRFELNLAWKNPKYKLEAFDLFKKVREFIEKMIALRIEEEAGEKKEERSL